MTHKRLELGSEMLEDRRMLAGNVTAQITAAGDLRIVGDNASNDITVDIDATTVTIESRDASTAINGNAPGATVVLNQAPTRDVRILMRGGDDNVSVGGSVDLRHATAIMGSGNDRIDFSGINLSGSLRANLGGGDMGGGSDFSPAGFDQSAYLRSLEVQGNVIVHGSSTHDMINVFNTDIDGRTNIGVRGGDDFVDLHNSITLSGTAKIHMGSGNDTAELSGVETLGRFRALGGSGFDSLLEGNLANDLAFPPELVGIEIA